MLFVSSTGSLNDKQRIVIDRRNLFVIGCCCSVIINDRLIISFKKFRLGKYFVQFILDVYNKIGFICEQGRWSQTLLGCNGL